MYLPDSTCTCTQSKHVHVYEYLPVHLMLVHYTITPVCSSIVLTGLDIIGGYDPVDVFTFTLCILCTVHIYT